MARHFEQEPVPRMLVVDDHPEVLSLFARILRDQGYQVWEASGGRQGLKMTRDLRPDVVILDVTMPDMNGLEVCRLIKNDPELVDVFVVLFSAVATSIRHEVNGLEIGADEYISKPAEFDGFLARIRTSVRLQRALAALRSSEQHFRQLIRDLPIAVGTLDFEGRITSANPTAVEMIAYSSAESLLTKTIFELLEPEDHERARAAIARILEHGVVRSEEFMAIRHSGERFPVEVNAAVSRGPAGEPREIVAVFRDVTRRNRAEAELRRLSRRTIEAQEAERQRVARELHDGVNQLIASAKMRLIKLESSLHGLSPAQREKFARCDHLLFQALEENRRIAQNLRPSDLDELGLDEACVNYCKKVEARSSLEVKSDVVPLANLLPREVEPNLFRIVQEAMNNVEQHAQARSVHLRIEVQGNSVVVRVKDDGQGFDPMALKPETRRGGGLTNIRERAAALGGSCEIESSPEQGTSVTVRVPCAEVQQMT